jgi:hypothetical protein
LLTAIWALCTPGALTFVVGLPLAFLDWAGLLRRFPRSPVLALLDRVLSGAGEITLLLGPLLSGSALVLLIIVLRSKDVPVRMKSEAAIPVVLSLASTLWLWHLAHHMWG